MSSDWTLETLKTHFDELRKADLEANNQRFISQEAAIDKAEANRDMAIKKAEDSIEKKSDAVYVKLTDLQKAFSEVMLRPEIEGRLNAMEKDIKVMVKVDDLAQGRHVGTNQGWLLASGIVGFAILVVGFLMVFTK